MKDPMAEQIEDLEIDRLVLKRDQAKWQNARAFALADIAVKKPTSPQAAKAVATKNEADSALHGIEAALEAKSAALDFLKKVRDKLDDPTIANGITADQDAAEKLRKDIDLKCKLVAKKTHSLAKELERLAQVEIDLKALDAGFDQTGMGRGGVSGWVIGHLAFFTGSGGFAFPNDVPAVPGGHYTAQSTIAEAIKRKHTQRAEKKVRRELVPDLVEYD